MAGDAPEPVPPLYIANLVAMLATGVLACGWLLFYTEWFPVVGGLLGLGGLFAWVAFVLGLLSEPRKKGMQAMFEAQVLMQPRTLGACVLALAALAVLTAFSGTLVLDAEGDTMDRMAVISDASGEGPPLTRTLVRAGAVRHLWFLAPPWGRPLRVELAGLPGVEARLASPARTFLGIPGSFRARPVLLVRPASEHSGFAAHKPDDYELRVAIGGHTESVAPFAGQTVWVGAGDDVPIPADLVRRWREELMIDATRESRAADTPAGPLLAAVEVVLARWDAPRSVFSSSALEPGDEVSVALVLRKDGHQVAGTTAVVRPLRPGDPVQEVVVQ